MEVIIIIALYFVVVNLINFILMAVDKKRAKNHEWRIPEAAFFIWGLMGGALGGILGMYTFRHKTRHWYFVWGLPAILVVEIILAIVLFKVLDLGLTIM